MGGIDCLVPYSVPNQCGADPSSPFAAEGDTHVDGFGALAFAHDRKCIPTDADGAPIRNGNVIRTLGQGLLIKTAVVQVHDLSILALPGLLDVMDNYTTTNLPSGDLLTLAATVYEIDPGPIPTLTGKDIDELGYDAYDLNPGDLPNVVVEGCTAIFNPTAGHYAQWFVGGNHGTFDDAADGTLNQLSVYRYDSGNPEFPLACPWCCRRNDPRWHTSRVWPTTLFHRTCRCPSTFSEDNLGPTKDRRRSDSRGNIGRSLNRSGFSGGSGVYPVLWSWDT